jgi:serine/threonine protein kinase
MSDSVLGLLQMVRRSRLLKPEQLNEIKLHWLPCLADSDALATRLVQSGWLTRYQLAQLLDGHDQSLQLGPYRPLGLLGEGALGVVYKARDVVRRVTVALKVLRPELRGCPEVLEQFWQEAAVLARLKHPAIVAGYDIEPGEARHYFAMEYVDGIDLARLLQLAGPLPPAQACDYVRQAAVGLQYAFEQGVVHRDIKPSNLLVAFAGGQVRILDIGSARREWPGAGAVAATSGGALMGTADYIAPEQTMDPDRADTRADIYSLGCTFYHLLTGRPPFPGSSLARKLLQHQQSPPPLLREARPELPEKLDAVVQRMLAKQPLDRYQTPALVAVALAPFCQDDAPRLDLERFRPAGDATADTLPTAAPAGKGSDTATEVNLPPASDQGPRRGAPSVDRRKSSRRTGNLIPVQIADPLGKDEPIHGWVVDRSAGGLGLVLRAAVEIGTTVKVHADRAGASAPWVQVRVIHCRRESARWRVGCQFVEQLGWDVRSQFG